ncbi:MAG: hypothetical protein A2033_18015 [Bacteroidetes bacterium GWA2_31_9]|nr:MAG: hypothetical protein A2033_18015 [Bacteroidetes bacterium GWA2_31_9]
MKTKIIITLFLFISIVSFAQLSNFDYSKSKILSIKIQGIDNIEKARYIDKQLLNSDEIIFVTTSSNDFITTVIANQDFSFEKLNKLILSQNHTCLLSSISEFDNLVFEQLYSSVNFSKETITKYGILKKYYTNNKTKDELNFSKYQEIIGLKK